MIDLYESSGIKRHTTDKERIARMYANSNLVISAWNDNMLIGIARTLTYFGICRYLSDLTVIKEYQSQGIGKQLITDIQKIIGKGNEISLLLLATPEAMSYYPKVGFDLIQNGFIIRRNI